MAPVIIVIFGLMGTGKTTLARALGEAQRWPVVHSDAVRKTLAGLPPTAQVQVGFGQSIYSDAFSRPTYAEMRRRAGEHLKTAGAVILDASFKKSADRRAVQGLAQEAGARVVFIYCTCPPKVVKKRLERRAANLQGISDGRLELMAPQAEDFDPVGDEDQPLLRLDTARPLARLLSEVQDFLTHLSETGS